MQPTEIPEDEQWTGSQLHIIGPPEGLEEHVAQIPALVDGVEIAGQQAHRFTVRFEPSALDRELIRQGKPVYVQFIGGIVPFNILIGSLEGE